MTRSARSRTGRRTPRDSPAASGPPARPPPGCRRRRCPDRARRHCRRSRSDAARSRAAPCSAPVRAARPRAAESGTMAPVGVSIGRSAMRSKSAPAAGSNLTTRSNAVPRSKMRPTVAPAKLVSMASATSPGRRPYRAIIGRLRTNRTNGTSICCSSDRSATPGTPAIAARTRSPSRRSVPRSSPNTLTAMLARVPDSMWSIRCEIG